MHIRAWTTIDFPKMFEKLKDNNWDTKCLTDVEFTVYYGNGYPISDCNSDKCILTKDEVDYTRRDKINIIQERVENEIKLRVDFLQRIQKSIEELNIEDIDRINNEFFTLKNYSEYKYEQVFRIC